MYEELNTEQMQLNQKLLLEARGTDVKVLTDTVYTTTIHLKEDLCTRQELSHTPLDAETGLVLAQATFSKVGKYANLEDTCAMEGQGVVDNIKSIESSGLSVTHVVSDGCTKILSGKKKNDPKNPEKLSCAVHVSRCQRRKVYASSFSSQLVRKKYDVSYAFNRTNLANKLVARCSTELTLAHTKIGQLLQNFMLLENGPDKIL